MTILRRLCFLIVAAGCGTIAACGRSGAPQAATPTTPSAHPPKPVANVQAELIGGEPTDAPTFVTFSSNYQHVAAVVPDHGRESLWIDGAVRVTEDGIRQAAISDDGRRVVYMALRKNEFYVVDGDNAAVPFDRYSPFHMSPDGSHLAYGALRDGQYQLVLDGREVATFAPPGGFVLSPDGQHLAYERTIVLEGRKQFQVVVDGNPWPPDQSSGRGALGADGRATFSADSKRFAYVAGSETDARVITDGVESGVYYSILSGPAFSPAGDLVFAAARPPAGVPFDTNGRLRKADIVLVVAGKESVVVEGGFDRGSTDVPMGFVWSADGSHLAYVKVSRDQGGATGKPVVDVHELAAHAGLTSIALSPDGSRVAYAWMDPIPKRFGQSGPMEGPWCVTVDRAPQQVFSSVTAPVFSPDGKHIAYGGLGHQWQVIFDGSEIADYSLVARKEPFLNYKLAAAGASYRFEPDGTLDYIGSKDGKWFRVRATPLELPATDNR